MDYPLISDRIAEHRYRFNYTPKVPEIKKYTVIETLFLKIKEFFEELYYKLTFWNNKPPFRLTEQQITLIKEARDCRRYYSEHRIIPYKNPLHSQCSTLRGINYPTLPTDPVLRHLHSFSVSFTHVLVNNVVMVEKVIPMLPRLKQQALTGIEQSPSWIKLLINLKGALTPILSKFGNFNDPSVTILLQQLMRFLLYGPENNTQKREATEQALRNIFKNFKDNREISETDHDAIISKLHSILDWLYSSNNWLLHSNQPAQLHSLLINCTKYIDTLNNLYRAGDFDTTIVKIQELFEENFEGDVVKMADINAKPLASFMTCRVSDLIENIPFTKTYDMFLRLILDHSNGWIKANEKYKETKICLADARTDLQLKATNAIQVKKQKSGQAIVDLAKEDGGDNEFLINQFLFTYGKQAICHPKVNMMAKCRTIKSNEKISEELFEELIEDIFPFIFPNIMLDLPNDSSLEVTGIISLLEEIQLSPKFLEIRDLIEQISNTTIEHADIHDKEKFKQYFQTLGKSFITELIYKELKGQAAKTLKEFIDKLCEKDFLDYLMAELILPASINKLINIWLRRILREDIPKFSKTFHEIIETQGNTRHVTDIFLEKLYNIVKGKCHDFDCDKAGINLAAFNNISKPLITEICQNLLSRLKKEDPLAPLSAKQVEDALNEYFAYDKYDHIKEYGDIITNMMFKIGSYGSSFEETMIKTFIDNITDIASYSFSDLRKSYHSITAMTLDTVSGPLLKPERVKAMFFSAKLSTEEQSTFNVEIQQKLTKNFTHTAALIHDLVFEYLDALPVVGFFAKKTTPETTEIHSLMTSIYNNFFKYPLLNKNLVVQSVKIIKNAFEEASTYKRATDNVSSTLQILGAQVTK